MQGTVIKSVGSSYEVALADGRMVTCRLRGRFRIGGIKSTNPLAVGDKVEVSTELSQTETVMVITQILPRKNMLVRKSVNLSKQTHILAANIDKLLLVATPNEPRTSLGFIDRYITAAEQYDIRTVLVFNKTDLYTAEDAAWVENVINLYSSIGYTCLRTSAHTGEGLESLKAEMKDNVCMIGGHSGVGKTALINAIDPSLCLKEGQISTTHNKGKHTTTFAQMVAVAGGFLIDTPGIKEFGITTTDPVEIRHCFVDFVRLQQQCRYNTCTHTHEPDCAIKKAVAEGQIAESRYQNYLNIIQSV